MASMFIAVSVVFAVLAYTVVSMVLVVTEVSLLHTWLPRFSRGWLSSSSGSPWSRGSRGSLGWCVFFCFLLFLLFLWFLMFLLFPLLVWLQSDVASQQLINLTLKMTIARFVETSVTVNNNPFQEHTHLDDHFPPTLDTGIYFHLSQYSGSFKVTLSCSKKHFITDLTYVQKPSLLLEKQLLARRYLPIYSESTEEEIF